VPGRIIDADLFFSLKTAEATIRDPDGMDLRDELSAREHARTVACELMRDREALTPSWRLDVRDGAGRQCFDLLFATTQGQG
jgi:hypothetical protein